MRPSRETILEQFRACALKLNKTPGRELFCQMCGLKQADINYYWPTHSALAIEAGFSPNKMNVAIPEEEIFRSYVDVCLHLKKVPTTNELKIAVRQMHGISANVYNQRFGTYGAFRNHFKQWLQNGSGEFAQILSFSGWNSPGWGGAKSVEKNSSALISLPLHPFLPTSLQYLDILARGLKPWPHFQESINTAFERRCADAFRCLGFEIRQLGQGHGRAADFLAIAQQERFAVILDAKVRGNGYVLGVEDRKFLEYARIHTSQIQQLGIDKVYFAVVGSVFRQSDLEKLTKYLADSPLRGVSMITAKALIRIVEESIVDRYKFRLSSIEQLLFGNKIIAD